MIDKYKDGAISTRGNRRKKCGVTSRSKFHGGRHGLLRPISSRRSFAQKRKRKVRSIVRQFLKDADIATKEWWNNKADRLAVCRYFSNHHIIYVNDLNRWLVNK